jgi:hypothetical protein
LFNHDVSNAEGYASQPSSVDSDSAHKTPVKDSGDHSQNSPADLSPDQDSNALTPQPSSGAQLTDAHPKPKGKYRRQLGPDGQPKKNFYNPPSKVMRHLAQQSYYDNFYGNQGQFYTLKQKYKT